MAVHVGGRCRMRCRQAPRRGGARLRPSNGPARRGYGRTRPPRGAPCPVPRRPALVSGWRPPRRGAVTGRRCWHDPRRPCARCRRAWRLRELLRFISSAERAAGQRLPLLPADFDSAFVRQGAPWTEPAQLDLFAPEPAPGALCGAETPPAARHPHPGAADALTAPWRPELAPFRPRAPWSVSLSATGAIAAGRTRHGGTSCAASRWRWQPMSK